MKGKPLLPVLRTKKRYVVYETISEKDIKHIDVISSVENSYKECFGTYGFAKAGMMDTKLYFKNKGIIKINNKYLDHLKTAITMITKINDNNIILHTINVSGVLNKAKLTLKGG